MRWGRVSRAMTFSGDKENLTLLLLRPLLSEGSSPRISLTPKASNGSVNLILSSSFIATFKTIPTIKIPKKCKNSNQMIRPRWAREKYSMSRAQNQLEIPTDYLLSIGFQQSDLAGCEAICRINVNWLKLVVSERRELFSAEKLAAASADEKVKLIKMLLDYSESEKKKFAAKHFPTLEPVFTTSTKSTKTSTASKEYLMSIGFKSSDFVKSITIRDVNVDLLRRVVEEKGDLFAGDKMSVATKSERVEWIKMLLDDVVWEEGERERKREMLKRWEVEKVGGDEKLGTIPTTYRTTPRLTYWSKTPTKPTIRTVSNTREYLTMIGFKNLDFVKWKEIDYVNLDVVRRVVNEKGDFFAADKLFVTPKNDRIKLINLLQYYVEQEEGRDLMFDDESDGFDGSDGDDDDIDAD